MTSGPIHHNEQLKKRSRSTGTSRDTEMGNGIPNRATLIGPYEQARQAPIAHGSGPIGPHEQAAVTIGGGIADPPPPPSPAARSRSKNGAGSQTDAIALTRLRFNVSLHAKLSKGTAFAVCVFSPDRNRGSVVIESIHVSVSRKGESMFD